MAPEADPPPHARGRALTNEQKRDAVLAGAPGSYNLAPLNGSDAEARRFGPIAAEAAMIARARGYPVRAERMGSVYRALLVTVPAARGRAPPSDPEL